MGPGGAGGDSHHPGRVSRIQLQAFFQPLTLAVPPRECNLLGTFANARSATTMGEKVVLPKFELPGDRTHPAVKVLAIVGGMMVLCTGILGMALWRHHSQQMAAEARQEALIAQRTAEANARPRSRRLAPPRRPRRSPAAQAAKAAPGGQVAAATATVASADADAGKSTGSHRRSSGHHRSSKATKTPPARRPWPRGRRRQRRRPPSRRRRATTPSTRSWRRSSSRRRPPKRVWGDRIEVPG